MTVTDVLCDLCYRTFAERAAVPMPAIGGRRSHVCHGCVHTLLGVVGVSDEEREKVNRKWPR